MAKGLQEFLWVAFPKAAGAAFQLLFNLILLRYFGPDQFGLYAVCMTVILLTDAVLGSAFDTAVLRQGPLYREEAPLKSLQVQQAGLLLKPLVGGSLMLPLVLLSRSISGALFHGRGSSSLLYLCAAAVMGLALFRSAQTHFQVDRAFRLYGCTDIMHNTLRYGGTGVLLLLNQASPARILGLFAAAPLAVAVVLLATGARPLLTVAPSAEALREIFRLVKSYLPTNAVGSITSRMDLIFVSSFATVAQAGIFAAAQTLILAPQMIGMYMGVVFSPRIMPLWKAGELRPSYERFQRLAIISCIAAYAVALLTASRIVALFLPASFQAATTVALILLPAALAAFVNFPWTISFLLFMRPHFLLKFDSIGLPLLAVLYALGVPAFGVTGAAAITTAYALVKTVALQKVAHDVLHGPLNAGTAAAVPDPNLLPAG